MSYARAVESLNERQGVMFSFFSSPQENIDYLSAKKPELHFDYDEIMYEAHHRAFTVAKITRLDLLSDIQSALVNAMNSGESFEEFKQNLEPILAKKGWLGSVVVKDPNTGKDKEIYVGTKRLKNIFNTNMRVSYAKSRYESAMASSMPYFRYTAVLDGNTRAAHAALHGKILAKNDPFWDTNYPPNGWNCRCKVMAISEDMLRSNGWEISNGESLPNLADKDWAYNPGKDDFKSLLNAYKSKIKSLENSGVSDKFIQARKDEYKNALKTLSQNLALFSAIKKFIQNAQPRKSANKIKISSVPNKVKELFKNENLDEIFLSEYTVASHIHHKNVSAYDYFLLNKIIGKAAHARLGNKQNSFVLYALYGKKYYRLVLKQTKENEIFIDSLVKGSMVEKEFKKFKNAEALQEL